MPLAARAARDPAWLFHTSGTTGRPKGVTLTQKNVMAAILGCFSDVDTIAPGDAIIHAAPMSHGSGFYMLPHVAHAGLNVVPESGGFEPAEIYALVQAHRGVTLCAAPTMVKRLVDHPGDGDTANLKTIVYGGGPMYVADCKAALCLDYIARFKRPKAYRYVGALPKNSTGKVLKTELRKLLQRP